MKASHLLAGATLLSASALHAEQWTKSDSNAWSNAASWTDNTAGAPAPPGAAGGIYTNVRLNLQGGTTIYSATEGTQSYDVSAAAGESRGLVMASGGSAATTLTMTGGELILIQEAATQAVIVQNNNANAATINLDGGKLTINEADTNGDTNTVIGLTGGGGSGTINVNNGGVFTSHIFQFATNAGTINLNNGGTLVTNRINDSGSTASSLVIDGGTIKVRDGLSGAVNLIDASLDNVTINAGGLTVDTTAASATINETLGGTGGITKTGAGQLTLSGENAYTGGTIVSTGTLRVSSATTAGAKTGLGTGPVSVSAATLNFSTGSTPNAQSHGNNITLADSTFVSNDGVVTYSGTVGLSGANTVQVVWEGKNATFSNVISGAGSLTKTGSGALILSGANSYAGDTTIQAGPCIIGAAGSIASPTVTVQAGSSLQLLSDTAAPVANLSATAAVALPGGTFDYRGNTETIASLSSNGGTLRLNPASALTLGTLDLTEGETTVSIEGYQGGSVTLMNVATINGPLSNLKSTLRGATFNHSAGVLTLATTPGTLSWTGAFSDNWNFDTTNWLNGATEDFYFNGDTVSFTDTPEFKNVILPASVSPGGVTVTNSSDPANNYTFSGPGAIAGTGGFTKNGTGLVTVGNRNTYTGPTIVNGGTLVLTGVTEVLGDFTPITINAGGTLDIAATNAMTRDLLTDAPITVNGGTLTQSTGAHAHIGNIILQNGATWTATSTGSFAGRNADLDGDVTVAGTGTQTIGSFTSGLGFDKRDVVFNVGDSTGSPASDLNVSASLRGSKGFTKAGAGTMFLSGTSNDYAGSTIVSTGILLLDGLSALPDDLTKVSVAAGAGFGGIVGDLNLTGADVAALASSVVWDAGGDARLVLDTQGQTVTLNSNIAGNFKILAVGGGTLNLTGTVAVNQILTEGGTTVNTGGGSATIIAITSNSVSTGTAPGTKKVTLAFTANGPVDIYASDTLQGWTKVGSGVTASPFVQDDIAVAKRFYVIVSAGQAYP